MGGRCCGRCSVNDGAPHKVGLDGRQVGAQDCEGRASGQGWEGETVSKTLLERGKIVETIRSVPRRSFTVLDFMAVFQSLYPEDWRHLVERYGQFGDKRRYTVTTYLSNRLAVYSTEPDSLLIPLTPYSEDRDRDYRKSTPEERKRFGSPWIAVFRKRTQGNG